MSWFQGLSGGNMVQLPRPGAASAVLARSRSPPQPPIARRLAPSRRPCTTDEHIAVEVGSRGGIPPARAGPPRIEDAPDPSASGPRGHEDQEGRAIGSWILDPVVDARGCEHRL